MVEGNPNTKCREMPQNIILSHCTCWPEQLSPASCRQNYLACHVMSRTGEEQEMQTGPQASTSHTVQGSLEASNRLEAALAPSAARFSHWLAAHNLSTRCIPPKAISTSPCSFFCPSQPRHGRCHWCECWVLVIAAVSSVVARGAIPAQQTISPMSCAIVLEEAVCTKARCLFLPLLHRYRHAISTPLVKKRLRPCYLLLLSG